MEVFWVCRSVNIWLIFFLRNTSNLFFTYAGAAFTKHLIHLYSCHGSNDLSQQIEVILWVS